MRLVLTHIGAGDCSTTKLSALLGVSPRALSNKLSVSGTSFKQLLDNARFEVAKQLLQNTSMTLADISWKLDYSEVSPFNRAFNRWCGTPPGDWRRNNRAQ
jgi:AraC-like DNA-binding protein